MKNILLLFLFLSSLVISQDQKVYVAQIEGVIDLGLAPYVKRVVTEAEDNFADAIIFRINTFGGRVDAATQIKDAILNSKVKTIAFIDKRAISAGALISLSCEKVVMVPGASIGATTVVDGAGTKQSEKSQSYMRSEMRATAERNGRPTNIAEGMVDERLVIEGLVDSTQLVTLTSKEAVKWGIADTIISNIDEVLEAYGLENADIIRDDSNWAEEVLRFIQNPIITSVLLMIGMVGMFTEMKTPGWGLPGSAAVIALTIFFGSHYILELASILEIVLFLIGVSLLIAEIFIIPGFGIAGIAGVVLIIGSLFMGLLPDFDFLNMGLIQTALVQLAGSFILTVILVVVLLKFLPKSKMFNRLILDQDITSHSGYTAEPDVVDLTGKSGIALTDLRPSGTAVIDSKRIDVVTEGDYIVKTTKVIVTRMDGSKIVVREDV
ncbi:MAG: nodulation protein NfeD [Melioribacteraceae bacterium]|nr:nodulation protein NfeD [Melioribacteraceae bacterium]